MIYFIFSYVYHSFFVNSYTINSISKQTLYGRYTILVALSNLILSYEYRLYLHLYTLNIKSIPLRLPIACNLLPHGIVVEDSSIRGFPADCRFLCSVQDSTLHHIFDFFCFRNFSTQAYFILLFQFKYLYEFPAFQYVFIHMTHVNTPTIYFVNKIFNRGQQENHQPSSQLQELQKELHRRMCQVCHIC